MSDIESASDISEVTTNDRIEKLAAQLNKYQPQTKKTRRKQKEPQANELQTTELRRKFSFRNSSTKLN